MRKYFYLVALIVLSFALINCGGGGNAKVNSNNDQAIDAPEWFLNPPKAEDAIYASGSAKKQSLSLAKETATARARDEITRIIEVKVKNMIKDFQQESGVNNPQLLEFTQRVSKQIANQTLSGSRIEKVYPAKDGTVYVLVSLSLTDLKNNTKNTIKNQIKNEEALYNEFKAKQAFDELDKAIDKMDSDSEK